MTLNGGNMVSAPHFSSPVSWTNCPSCPVSGWFWRWASGCGKSQDPAVGGKTLNQHVCRTFSASLTDFSHTYRMVWTQLEGVRREDGNGEESQEHEAADGRVLDVGVGCGGEEHDRRWFFTKRAHFYHQGRSNRTKHRQEDRRTYLGSVYRPGVAATWRRHTWAEGSWSWTEWWRRRPSGRKPAGSPAETSTRVLTQNQTRGMTFSWKHWFNVGNVCRIQLEQHLPCWPPRCLLLSV